mgnify:FL=1|tara:strand:- start:4485 stop:4874 length:390 start_codon:yes stop_codon:yes gene_type:complete
MFITVLFYTLVAAAVIGFYYNLSFIFFLLHKNSKKPTDNLLSIASIFCAKNKANNLNKLIPLLLSQDYKTYELVLINNTSNNDTLVVLSAKKLKEISTIFLLPLLDVFLVQFQFTIFITNSISKPTHWK